jgi:glycine oxidase
MLTGREVHRFEPALASGLPGAVYACDDHQVDNRALHQALAAAARSAGVDFLARSVRRIDSDGERVTGVSLAEDGDRVRGQWVVVAAGAHTRHLDGLPDGIAAIVRPVKGQTIRLVGHEPLVTHVLRGSVKGSPVYIVPRESGEIVVGASSEDVGFDLRPRVGAVYELLRDAFALLPGLAEWTWAEVSTGLRPGTPDNGPLVGPTSMPGLVIASGHYRNGMLLAPITADGVAAHIDERPPPRELAGFSPDRFARIPAMKEGSR